MIPVGQTKKEARGWVDLYELTSTQHLHRCLREEILCWENLAFFYVYTGFYGSQILNLTKVAALAFLVIFHRQALRIMVERVKNKLSSRPQVCRSPVCFAEHQNLIFRRKAKYACRCWHIMICDEKSTVSFAGTDR